MIDLESTFKLTCYSVDGIEDIKFALGEGEKMATDDVKIQYYIAEPPTYKCKVTVKEEHEQDAIRIMNKANNVVRLAIEEKDGYYELISAPTSKDEQQDDSQQEDEEEDAESEKFSSQKTDVNNSEENLN